MNHCDISEEETTKALYQLSIPESQTNMHIHINGIGSRLTLADVQHPGQNHQNPSSHDMPNQGNKKYGCKKISNAGNNSGQIPNPAKNHRQEPLKSRSLTGMHNLDVEKHVHKQKEKHMKKGMHFVFNQHFFWGHHQTYSCAKVINFFCMIDAGDLEQTKTKNKREADKYGGEAFKKAKTEDVCYNGKNCNFKHGRDLGKVCLVSDPTLPAKATGEEVIKSNEICCSMDSNFDQKDRVLISVKKLEDQDQVSLDGGSLAMRTCDKRDISLKKRKLKEWEDTENQADIIQTTKHHLQENKASVKENSETELRKEKKTKLSIEEGVEYSTCKGDDRSRKGVMTRIPLSGSKDAKVDNIEEERTIEKDLQHRTHKQKVVSQQTLDSVDSMKKDLGTGRVLMAATSSSSKVSGSHKTRANFQQVKGSPAESVSSSPPRTSKLDNLTTEKGGILRKGDATDSGLSMVSDLGRCLGGVGNRSCNQSEAAIKDKVSSVFPPESRVLHIPDYRDGDAKSRFSSKAKLGTSCVVKGDVVTSEQRHQYNNDLHAVEHCDNENRKNENYFWGVALFPRESGRGSSKESNRSSRSDFDDDKMKVCDPLNEQEDLHARKSLRCKLENDPQHLARYSETLSNVKHGFPDQDCIKHNDNHVNKENSLGKWSSDSKKENQLKFREYEGSNLKLGESCSLNGIATPQHFLNMSIAKKTELKELDSRGETMQLFPHHEGEHKTLAHDFQSVPGLQKEDIFYVCSVGASVDADSSKVLKEPANANGTQQSVGHLLPNEHRVRDLSVSSPMRKHSSGPAASNTLKEAKDLRDYADRLKVVLYFP